MRFARTVFAVAGVWGLAILTPMYFLADSIGRSYPPPITHPDFYYGFIGVALAWQLAFLVIARDPIRFRPFMILAMVEKFGFMATIGVLWALGAMRAEQVAIVSPDLVLGCLFVAAYLRTPATSS